MPGSKKGRKFSAEARKNISDAARNRKYAPGVKEKLADQLKAQRADPEWEAKRIAALQESMTGVKCPSDCQCERHTAAFRQKLSEVASQRVLSEEHKKHIGESSKVAWAKKTPEERSEIAWQRIKKYGVAKVSQEEYSLAPYLARLGYKHNDDRALVVGRKFPDFYNMESHKVFEYFGSFWHPRPEEEHELVEYYKSKGWDCQILWDHDREEWMAHHG